MTAATAEPSLTARSRDILKRAGNPFRNYFARNPDDEVCARYHVPELFAAERDLLHAIIDLYRYDPLTHSEVVPVLGNKGAGKTHLLHSIKHGTGGQWQLLVTPGVYQKDSEFLEYLLFQIIDTLLGGGKQKGVRPLDFIGDQLVRRALGVALRDLSPGEKVELFPPPTLGRWARRLGLGTQQAQERAEWLAENLSGYSNFARMPTPLGQALADAGLSPQKAFDLLALHVQKTEAHNTAGLMRRHIFQGFARAALLQDESDLANFLTYGFAELDFHVRPSRQDLVLALFKVLMEVFRSLKTPVVVAFDQLEDLLLARRSDDAHKTAEAFFAGIVQVMHQIDGLCFLIFAERGLWNRFVPSLDGYIQDRLNNPVHVPRQGTVKAIRLEAPAADLFRRVAEARLRPCLDELPETGEPVADIYPFSDEQVLRIARTEPTLRDMLQQCRHLFDHLVYGPDDQQETANSRKKDTGDRKTEDAETRRRGDAETGHSGAVVAQPAPVIPADPPVPQPGPVATRSRFDASGDLPFGKPAIPEVPPAAETTSRIAALLGHEEEAAEPPGPADSALPVAFKRVEVIEAEADVPMATPVEDGSEGTGDRRQETGDREQPEEEDRRQETGSREQVSGASTGPCLLAPGSSADCLPSPGSSPQAEPPARVVTPAALVELWDQEQRAARRKLEPEGALTGATRELQAGLGAFLSVCHEHGVKVGPWRLQHVVPEWTFGDHPTYGAVTIAHWACKDGQPWKVGIGLFLARGAGKPKDLEVKLGVMDAQPAVVDVLILLRPEDDLALTAKSKTLWAEAERKGRHARLEAVTLDGFAQLYSAPRWLAAAHESLPTGSPLPNLADIIQEKCEKLLEQVCMPVQG